MPVYSPGPPKFCEFKKYNKPLRPLQLAIGEKWKDRGCDVLKPVLNMRDCEERCNELIELVSLDYYKAKAGK